jgi:hypothetical protein
MTRLLGLIMVTGVALGLASERAKAFPTGADFTIVGLGGSIPDYDQGIAIFPATPTSPIPFIKTLTLEIEGLAHSAPGDLDIYLISPFEGQFIEVMTDRGGGMMNGVTNINLLFDDGASGSPGTPLVTGTYRPDGLADGNDGGLGTFLGRNPGLGTWLLLVIDDSPGGTGSIARYTLRGTVPEPMSLSLLAIGAVALLRRRLSA